MVGGRGEEVLREQVNSLNNPLTLCKQILKKECFKVLFVIITPWKMEIAEQKSNFITDNDPHGNKKENRNIKAILTPANQAALDLDANERCLLARRNNAAN
jgi:hypothetical protein